MNKSCATGTIAISYLYPQRPARRSFTAFQSITYVALAVALAGFSPSVRAQETEAATSNELPDDFWTEVESPVYPRGAVMSADSLFVVDSDAPGVWKVEWPATEASKPVLQVTGSRYLRKTMNRPFCATPHPESGVLVGDAATREIYHVTPDEDGPAGQNAKPLNNGFLGIPMALTVSPEGKTIYVGDAERRAVFSLPIDGGQPELVVRVNARGLVFDEDGGLWAVTPDAEAVVKIDVENKSSEAVVTERPYGFPGGIAWHDGTGFVSDVYGKCVWTFTADGKTEKWFEGDLLKGPVGMSATADAVIVSDPKSKQVFRIDRESKEATPLFED
ncbi:hypothetical protein [Rhodopirellula halodulae]|uniref:hypothetical protein n=1 Tax=Rhodopirellula halodulae TaxID=2894198 RepID=UPI001E426D85|nr:hypothetical protein [Rhodopirellula sp. JC737]MCC9656429.1 hypothetical protein [Rhodopirellula sp. JC737]